MKKIGKFLVLVPAALLFINTSFADTSVNCNNPVSTCVCPPGTVMSGIKSVPFGVGGIWIEAIYCRASPANTHKK